MSSWPSCGVSSPSPIASRMPAAAPTASRWFLTRGNANATGCPLGGGSSRSKQTRNAVPCPAVARAMRLLARSPTRASITASTARVALLRAPAGRAAGSGLGLGGRGACAACSVVGMGILGSGWRRRSRLAR
jgi:hypothetical protein